VLTVAPRPPIPPAPSPVVLHGPAPGTKVTVTNKDGVAHTWSETSGPKPSFDLSVPPGGSATFTFETAGTYDYRCQIHTFMTGTVVVS
jgi:plastocyanin